MQGNMMQSPLLISSILRQAANMTPTQQVVSRAGPGELHRYAYLDCYRRTCQLAGALEEMGIVTADRVASLALNGYRHLELYYAVSGLGAVMHTVNPRLFHEQIAYIINHAADRILFAEVGFVPLLNAVRAELQSVERIVLLCDADHAPTNADFDFVCYESLLTERRREFAWPAFSEECAATLCYTSGTTGDPKGVLYSHRSTALHALACSTPNGFDLSRASVVLPVVPMYHVAAWGLPYSGLMAGVKLVLPGGDASGPALHELIWSEGVTLALGVPTVWLGLLRHLDENRLSLPAGLTLGVGGAAMPQALVTGFRRHGCYVMPLWGMTETSPLATFGTRPARAEEWPEAELDRLQTSAGKPLFGIEIEIFDDADKPLPHDGSTSGALRARGPWVVERYYRGEHVRPREQARSAERSACIDGWFDTGDVATIDGDGWLRIVDRKKDVVKSGGEWISSIALENAALSHPEVREACAIGVPHAKWDERPLLLVVLVAGCTLDKEQLREHLAERMAKWWLPDDILAVDELPHTATGKLHKLPLREIYRDHYAAG